jgi:hypothetical protein
MRPTLHALAGSQPWAGAAGAAAASTPPRPPRRTPFHARPGPPAVLKSDSTTSINVPALLAGPVMPSETSSCPGTEDGVVAPEARTRVRVLLPPLGLPWAESVHTSTQLRARGAAEPAEKAGSPSYGDDDGAIRCGDPGSRHGLPADPQALHKPTEADVYSGQHAARLRLGRPERRGSPAMGHARAQLTAERPSPQLWGPQTAARASALPAASQHTHVGAAEIVRRQMELDTLRGSSQGRQAVAHEPGAAAAGPSSVQHALPPPPAQPVCSIATPGVRSASQRTAPRESIVRGAGSAASSDPGHQHELRRGAVAARCDFSRRLTAATNEHELLELAMQGLAARLLDPVAISAAVSPGMPVAL